VPFINQMSGGRANNWYVKHKHVV